MLTMDDARRNGLNACAEKIGKDFLRTHQENSTMACSEMDDVVVSCFVGVNDQPAQLENIDSVTEMVLTSYRNWPYFASCKVNRTDGTISFTECKLPGF